MSSIWINNIAESLKQKKSANHYLSFGPCIIKANTQTNMLNNLNYTEYVGDYVCFQVSESITLSNWYKNHGLNEYFKKIQFNPFNLKNYWKKSDIKIFDSYQELLDYFTFCYLIDNKFVRYIVIHNLKFENDHVISSKLIKLGEPDYLLSELYSKNKN